MNKIKELFKASPIAMVVVSLVIAGVVSAAVVNYLSDEATGAVAVGSPIEMSINLGGSHTNLGNKSVTIDDTTGLSTVFFTTVAKNNANNPVEGYRVIILEDKSSSPENLTGQEFTEVLFGDANTTPKIDIFNHLYAVGSTGTLYELSTMDTAFWPYKEMILIFTTTGNAEKYELAAGEVNWNDFEVTLGNIVGDYEISTQYVDDLADYAAEQY